jgi:hypothetical protein
MYYFVVLKSAFKSISKTWTYVLVFYRHTSVICAVVVRLKAKWTEAPVRTRQENSAAVLY